MRHVVCIFQSYTSSISAGGGYVETKTSRKKERKRTIYLKRGRVETSSMSKKGEKKLIIFDRLRLFRGTVSKNEYTNVYSYANVFKFDRADKGIGKVER